MVKTKAILLSIAAMTMLGACGKKATDFSSSGSGGGPTPVINYPFEVLITTQYETAGVAGGTVTTEADCQVATGTASGTVAACTNSTGAVNNTVAIPEGRLYFSALNITVNVGNSSTANGCEIVLVNPFSYQASNSATFLGPWMGAGATPIDCSGATALPTSDCYGGVGKDMVPSFPAYRSLYFLTAQALSSVSTAHSAVSHHHGSNRFATNNLVNRAASHAWSNGDAYLLNTYQDYSFTCADRYMQTVYGFTLKLTDVDITGVYPNASQGVPTINQFPDWDVLSYDY